MSDQSEALMLADHILSGRFQPGDFECEAAAELRRQHSRIEELENELMEQCRINGMGAERELAKIARIEADEALMRQAEKALDLLTDESMVAMTDETMATDQSVSAWNNACLAITALRKRLESSNG